MASNVGAVLRSVPFSPAVTGTLLYLLTRGPDRVRVPLLQWLHTRLSANAVRHGITFVKWLFALGVVRNIHVFLNELAQNNFRFSSERHRYNWPKEVAVVTGAASGFGALMSKDLAAKGVNVVAVDIKEDLPQDMKGSGKIHYYKCNIADRAAVIQLAETVRSAHGEPSILINNAGVAYEHSVLHASEHALRNMYGVNIIAHYFTLQAFLPAMIANKKGHVVSLASMASFLTPTGIVPYCDTKAAVLSLHEGLQQEMRVNYHAPEIKFTIVHPTYAATPMVTPFINEVRAAKVFVLSPQVVSDAVVKQILSCRGRQIILAGGDEWLSCIRGWPHWISQSLIRSTDGQIEIAKVGQEKHGG